MDNCFFLPDIHYATASFLESEFGNDGEQTDPSTVSANQAHPGQRSASQQGRPTPSHRSSGSLLLILLTISVTVCWTPNNVFFTWAIYYSSINSDLPVFFNFTLILIALQATIDPIMFTCAIASLRQALRQTFHVRSST
ncbi:hypothetical protein BV898_15093 [Hypsibius exemplaris]|uniref:G-protein coupled receptors family 1 profile domain-containing protein n=1 Tax=Hypsibius exemplaris TaxID=2072580 RepID=A0A9X6NA10_HYPEX|nr:hypothetical protein BV898_15093 [Hypsibius exemplaris]